MADPQETLDMRGRLSPVPVVVKAFFFGTMVVGFVAVLGFSLGAEWDLVKVGEENNLPTWFSSIQLFAIAAVLSSIVVRDTDRSKPRSWALAVVPGLFLLLSLDEVAMLHERLGEWLEEGIGVGTGLRTGPWVVVFVPLIGILTLIAAVVFWSYLKGRRDVLVLAVVGVGALGFSAVGLELLANLPADGSGLHKLLGFAEEMGEMLAGTIILWSAILVVQLEGIRIDLGTPRRTSSS